MELEGKVVVITGASSGIGRATALRFAREGARITLNSKSNVVGGQEAVTEARKLGAEAIYVQGDMSEPDQVMAVFAATVEKFGTVDVLINNAGSTVLTPFLKSTKEDWLKMWNDNLISAFLCSQAAAELMLEKGRGKIINTASVRGIEHTGREGIMAYSAAKAALINFTKTLAKQLSPTIAVNAVAPGFVYTANYERMPKEQTDAFIEATLIKRFITVDEVAEVFSFLARMDAITGEVLVVDGGFTLKVA